MGGLLFALLGFGHTAVAQEPGAETRPQRKLYVLHCAGCHGASGKGDGVAARFVFPKPRDFTTGKIRLVSTANRVASTADIRGSIERGFPGTSMQGWKQLGDESLDQLVAEVMRLREEGVRKRFEEALQEEGAKFDAEKIASMTLNLTRPGKTWQPPGFAEPDDASVERGRQVYLLQSCDSCHGKQGDGSWKMDLVDGKGRPSWATDLRFDHYKGRTDATAIARRIVLGMPGSAMPSSRKLSDQQLGDLVRFCQSLAFEAKYDLTNHQRAQRAVGFRRPSEPP